MVSRPDGCRRSALCRVRGVGGVVYLAKRNGLSCGDPGTVVEFRTECRRSITEPTKLASNWAKWRLDFDGLPLELMTAHRITADTQRGRLTEEQILERGNLRLVAQNRHHDAGPILFIWIGVMKASSAPASMSFVMV